MRLRKAIIRNQAFAPTILDLSSSNRYSSSSKEVVWPSAMTIRKCDQTWLQEHRCRTTRRDSIGIWRLWTTSTQSREDRPRIRSRCILASTSRSLPKWRTLFWRLTKTTETIIGLSMRSSLTNLITICNKVATGNLRVLKRCRHHYTKIKTANLCRLWTSLARIRMKSNES